jgi:hypothetical protein
MTSQDELAKEAKILDLFDSYPSASPTAETVRAYVQAVAGLSAEAVARSVTQFTSGLVERPNRDFAPSAEAFAANVRDWQRAIDSRDGGGVTLHTGILNMDFGAGSIDMRGLTEAEQDAVIAAKGRAPDGRSLAYMPLAEIKAALGQADLAQVEGGRSFQAPKLGRMGT